jgi:hypothetical protein
MLRKIHDSLISEQLIIFIVEDLHNSSSDEEYVLDVGLVSHHRLSVLEKPAEHINN